MLTEETKPEDAFDISEFLQDKPKKKKSGGFQNMGLSHPVLKGVLRKGYKVPTPIQRKTVPVILEGHDVVGMARTGSGKTAAFLVPLLERLKSHLVVQGARALVLSPTRELAMQTYKFTKELGRFTNLRSAVVLGGDKIEDQFSSIHENPDIIIATPGRFLHIVMEMDLKLHSVQYVVFDEADRLFEMGFQEQLQEILHRLPEERQTVLFSATLPRLLVDFAKAGLTNPTLIRLDTEASLSPLLKTAYFICRSEDKLGVLFHLIRNVIQADEMTVVFLATKHHVEYVKMFLELLNIPCAFVYSSLDPAARKIQVAKFHAKKAKLLLVTDIAARGIDIPVLDNVINVHFPAQPKLYVHRVGRVARAGRSGTAYSILAPDEAPYFIDLQLFLGRPIQLSAKSMPADADGVCGSLLQSSLDEEMDSVRSLLEKSVELAAMSKVCSNAYKQYLKSRPLPATESVKRAKEMFSVMPDPHPLFKDTEEEHGADERAKMIADMRNYRPNNTIFEIGATARSQAFEIMRGKKAFHQKVIEQARFKKQAEVKTNVATTPLTLQLAEEEQIQETFSTSLKKKKSTSKPPPAKKIKSFQDEEYFLPYQSKNHYSDKGMEIDKSFARQAAGEVLDLAGDDESLTQKNKSSMKWDRKKKKFVNQTGMERSKKKIKTESGAWVPATYKTDLYKKWKERNRSAQENSEDEAADNEFGKQRPDQRKGKWKRNDQRSATKHPPKRELKSKDEILKHRKTRGIKQFHQKRRQIENSRRRNKK